MKQYYLLAVIVVWAGLLAGCRAGDVALVPPDSHITEDPTVQPRDADPAPSPTATLVPSTPTARTVEPDKPTATSEPPTTGPITPADHTPPAIAHIATSTVTFTISDCSITEVTVTADIADPSGVDKPTLWYRVRAQSYTPVAMQALGADRYSVTVKGVDLPRNEYGVWEFYLTAQDAAGNAGKSPVNQSVQFLPCAAR
jgi:hypothetical protein